MTDILREGFNYEFSRLDPTSVHIDPPSVAIYEPLIVKGPDWRAYPLLASGWEVSEDRLRWRFRLRADARFHSGASCDAEAVLRAFEFLRWGMGSGQQLCYWDPVDTVAAVGSDVVEVRLHYPYERLPSLLWGTHTAVYNEALRSADLERFGHEVADGTGPYRLVSWTPRKVVAERWDAYPQPAAPFLRAPGASPRRIEWIALPDPSERLDALERGAVHAISAPPLEELPRLRADPRFAVVEFPQQSDVYLALNFEFDQLPFDDVRLRRALSLAIDREAIVADVLHGHASPSYCAVPRGDEFFDPAVERRHRHDPAEAVRLLDLLGSAVGEDGVRVLDGVPLRVRCICQDDAVLLPIAAAARDHLRRVGVVLELDPIVPFAPFYDAAVARPPAIVSRWHWPDPIDALIGFTASRSRGEDNWQQASVPALDAAFEAWLRAGADELAQAASRVQSVIAGELPYIPLVTLTDVWAHVRELVGYRPYKANLYPFYQPVRLNAR